MRIVAELADWWKAHCATTARSYSSVATEALTEYRDRAPSLESLAQSPLGQQPGSKLAPLQGRDVRFIEIPDDLHRWMQVYAAMMGRSGDWVLTEALSEYRARIEALEPCRHG